MAVKKKRKVISPSPPSPSHKRQRGNPFPGSPTPASKTVPPSGDWKFRLKVISAQAIDEEVFVDAVRGLTYICFPDSVLDELGVDVVTQHMEQESAPETNISKMQEIFQSVMIERLACLFARYLDKPTKFNEAISTIVTAIEELHGYSPGHTPVTQANVESDHQTDIAETYIASADSSVYCGAHMEEDNQKSKKRKDCRSKNTDDARSTSTIEPSKATILAPQNSKNAQDYRVLKVSKTWRWDVDRDQLTRETIAHHFKETSDLFAFHALPIVNHELGPASKRKEKRRAINSRLAAMSSEELQEWDNSFDKLSSGDLTMLDRIGQDVSDSVKLDRTTPAPTTFRRHQIEDGAIYRRNGQSISMDSGTIEFDGQGTGADINNDIGYVNVKRESAADIETAEFLAKDIEQLSNDNLAVTVDSGSRYAQRAPSNSSTQSDTPLLDLLWGVSPLRLHGFRFGAQTILSNLRQRIADDSISNELDNGQGYHTPKNRLRRHLSWTIANDKLSDRGRRIETERCLLPWAIARPLAFPELRDTPLFFVHSMLAMTPLSDLIFGSLNDGNTERYIQLNPSDETVVFERLEQRGIWPDISCGLPRAPLGKHIHDLLRNKSWDIWQKRVRMEQYLREAVFMNRNKFPELSSSPPVKAWEELTKLKWN